MTNRAELDAYRRFFYHPYAQVVPWVGVVGLLAAFWGMLHVVLVNHYRDERGRLEEERTEVRRQLAQHAESRQAHNDMGTVLAALPLQRDFAPLALGLTEQAKSNGVRIPGLSYQVERTDVQGVTRAVLQGAMIGRYEHIRLFIHNLETAQELVLIENLDVDRSHRTDQELTVNLRLVTYLRSAPVPSARM